VECENASPTVVNEDLSTDSDAGDDEIEDKMSEEEDVYYEYVESFARCIDEEVI